MADGQIARPKRRGNPFVWRYLSFACHETGDFQGATILQARSQEVALVKACDMGIYPGGDILAADLHRDAVPKAAFLNRLLNREEVTLAFPAGVYSTREKRAIYDVN